ncbi:phage portal protein [Schaalia sp. ZJ1691]|uniref:phage portal protein n=1 Tax=Schaalia sp. ZJ1691 TaxID=2709404 RepID=UPI0013EDC8C5|nr:phage portal protein [Schaalia sp. ZJ1691]
MVVGLTVNGFGVGGEPVPIVLPDDPVDDLVEECLSQIRIDYESSLGKVDEYLRGVFDDPYSPEGMSVEAKATMDRARQNWCEIPVKAAVQALAVDGFRGGDQRLGGELAGRESSGEGASDSPEWAVWQRSNLDSRQSMVHRSAVAYGQGFVVSMLGDDGKSYVRPLSATRTVMLFEDVLSDDNAVFALSVMRWPGVSPAGKPRDGLAYGWDREYRYVIRLPHSGKEEFVVDSVQPHGGRGHCPVTRFVAQMDDNGKVSGSVAEMIPWQDSFNQVLFNLLVAQMKDAHRILWGTGLELTQRMGEDGSPKFKENGEPDYVPVKAGPGDFIVNTSPDGKFGEIPGGSQSGYIESLDMLVKHFSALTQTPPNFLLGQMANLSAEALYAAEKSFQRKVDDYKRQFGEAWERALRISRIQEGYDERPHWESNEVLWKDLEHGALSQTADALFKLREIGVPTRGLWQMIPGVSPVQLDEWQRLLEQSQLGEDLPGALAEFGKLGEADRGRASAGDPVFNGPGSGGVGDT